MKPAWTDKPCFWTIYALWRRGLNDHSVVPIKNGYYSKLATNCTNKTATYQIRFSAKSPSFTEFLQSVLVFSVRSILTRVHYNIIGLQVCLRKFEIRAGKQQKRLQIIGKSCRCLSGYYNSFLEMFQERDIKPKFTIPFGTLAKHSAQTYRRNSVINPEEHA